MPPRKAKDLVQPTADKLDLNVEFVQDAIDFYWKAVRKSLSNLKCPRIIVSNFGSFQIRAHKLDDQKKKYEGKLKYYQPEEMTFQKHKIKQELENKLAAVEKMIDTVKQDKERKKEIRKKRYAE